MGVDAGTVTVADAGIEVEVEVDVGRSVCVGVRAGATIDLVVDARVILLI